MSCTVCIIRVIKGFLLVPDGVQKMFGWFGGYGVEVTGQFSAAKLGLPSHSLSSTAQLRLPTSGRNRAAHSAVVRASSPLEAGDEIRPAKSRTSA